MGALGANEIVRAVAVAFWVRRLTKTSSSAMEQEVKLGIFSENGYGPREADAGEQA